jgi:hypothetical protein
MIILILLLFFAMVFDAVGDALRFRKHSIAHHIMETLQIGCWIGAMLFMYYGDVYPIYSHQIAWVVVFYISARMTFFDYIFNITAGLKWNYAGNTSYWDKMRRIWGDFIKIITFVFFIFSIFHMYNLIN